MALSDSVDFTAEDRTLGGSRARRCIVTGETLPEARLIRFVAAPDGEIVPDIEANLPGRGIWVHADSKSIEHAVTKRLFARAAGQAVSARPDLAAFTETRLVARLLAQLGIARRAGALILGFDQVERALRSERPPAVIIEASDAAPDGTRKLQAAARANGVTPFVIAALSSEELSLALARANVIHAALKSGRIAERLVFEAGRLNGFRSLKPWVWAGFSGGGGGTPGA